jgi:hypothetical protein
VWTTLVPSAPSTTTSFRTLDGAENFCVIRSCLDTLDKQGYNMLAVLKHAFAGTPIYQSRAAEQLPYLLIYTIYIPNWTPFL